MKTLDEALTNLGIYNQSEWRREQRLWSLAHDLCNRLGMRPTSEDLEDFVANHMKGDSYDYSSSH
jgi:hypothetical protein